MEIGLIAKRGRRGAVRYAGTLGDRS
jgi:hypothetical protein